MFVEKLNKKQSGVYVIEEEKAVINGIWEGCLDHDNVDHRSISIYTGSKLTGEKIENYFVSTPSEMPWKTYLKVFNDNEKVYVVYESTGDQVEADDINLLQDVLVDEINRATTEEIRIDNKLDDEISRSIDKDNKLDTRIDSEITRSKAEEKRIDTKLDSEISRATSKENQIETDLGNEIIRSINKDNDIVANLNAEISRSTNKDNSLDQLKANKSYVDAELLKKYDKTRVYNKEEVTQLIDDLIGGSPEALDTLKEIADALNNDPDFAATMTTELAKKVDKIAGKGLSDENYSLTEKTKLAGVEANANNYTHPSSHPASFIIESATKRFASDVEKANWNDANSRKHDHSNKTVIDKITQVLLDSWNNAVTHISDAIRHITSAERTKWNTVDNKADKTQVLTNVPVNAKFTDTVYTHPSSHPASFIIESATKRFVTDTEKTSWNNKADKIAGKGFSDENYTLVEKNKLAGIAVSANNYTHPSSHPPTIIAQNATNRFVTDTEKSTWNAKETPSGAQTKATAALNSAKSYAEGLNFVANEDTRAVNSPPSFYGGRRVTYEFKQSNVLGLSGLTYVMLETINPWSGYGSSHIPSQIAHMGKIIYTRQATSASAWGPWSKIFTQGTPLTCNDLKGV